MLDDLIKEIIKETVLLTLRDISSKFEESLVPQVMNTKQLAEYLGVSVHWVYKNTAELPHEKRGKKVLYLKGEIDEWRKNKREEKELMSSRVTIQSNVNKNCSYKVS